MKQRKREIKLGTLDYKNLFYKLVYHKLGDSVSQNSSGTSGQTGTTINK